MKHNYVASFCNHLSCLGLVCFCCCLIKRFGSRLFVDSLNCLGLHASFSFCQGHVAGLRMRVAIQTMLVLKWTLPLTFWWKISREKVCMKRGWVPSLSICQHYAEGCAMGTGVVNTKKKWYDVLMFFLHSLIRGARIHSHWINLGVTSAYIPSYTSWYRVCLEAQGGPDLPAQRHTTGRDNALDYIVLLETWVCTPYTSGLIKTSNKYISEKRKPIRS